MGEHIYAELSWNVEDIMRISKDVGIQLSTKDAEQLLEDYEDEIQVEEIRVGTNIIKNLVLHLKKRT